MDIIVCVIVGNVAQERQLRGGVVFVESIPRTISGKIIRRLLRDMPATEGN